LTKFLGMGRAWPRDQWDIHQLLYVALIAIWISGPPIRYFLALLCFHCHHWRHLAFYFYRVMHFSAKRGLAVACRPSLRPSVTLVDCGHIGWKSWKLIARTISPTPPLFVAKRRSTYSQGNMGTFWADYADGVRKSGVMESKSGNICEMCKDRGKVQKLLWKAYRNSPTLFRTVPSPTPYGFPFPKIGVATPLKTAVKIAGKRVHMDK